MNNRIKFRKYSIKRRIIFSFIFLMTIFSVTSGYIIFSNWSSSNREVEIELAKDLNEKINVQISAFIHGPMHITEVNYNLIGNNIVDMTNEIEYEQYFVSVLLSHETEVYSFMYGTEMGEFYGARRNAAGEIEIMKNNTDTSYHTWYYSVSDDLTAEAYLFQTEEIYDSRTRDWYIAAKNAQTPIFPPIYKNIIMNDLTITAACPIYNQNGELQGVLAADYILSGVNMFLNQTVNESNGIAVIINMASGELIANTLDIANFTILEDDSLHQTTIDEMENDLVKRAYDQYLSKGESSFLITDDSGNYYFKLTEIHENGLDWLVISAIPETHLLAPFTTSLWASLFFLALTLAFAIVLHWVYSKKAFKPIEILINASEKYASGDYSVQVPIIKQDEIGDLSIAFNQMARKMEMMINHLKEVIGQLELFKQKLEESNEKYIAIFNQSPIAIEFYDANGLLLHANEACIQLFGVLDRNEVFEFKLFDNPNLSLEIKTKIANRERVFVESEFSFEEVKRLNLYQTNCSGTKILSLSISPLLNGNTLTGYVVQTEDITFKKQKQKEIEYLSNHDYLSDLYNRKYYFEQFNLLNKSEYYPLGIMMLDVNGLKIVNDAFGHVVGDIALKTLGNVLKETFEQKDIISRIGGDEFAVLLPNTTNEKLQAYKEQIVAIVKNKRIKNVELSLAIGYKLKNSMDEDIDDLFKLAENYMYRHKITEGSSVRTRAINAILQTLTDKYETERIHSQKVSYYCKLIGQHLKLRADDMKELEQAGMFHDIGKISIPDSILNKPGKLTDEEYDVIKTHVEVGYQILRAADEYSDLAIHALHHHERWDGNGYPSGLKGKDIPLFSRIISVVDAYEAMTADRPYRSKLTQEYAISEIIRFSGTQFDPKIAKLFVEKVLKANWK
ncbi:MAG: HD domain-containing phosphohydrolase [Bacillota bacterium]